jgi:choline dehydrogenase-like flavoprotein
MIIYPKDIKSEDVFDSDFCIIGSGPAGISIALELVKANKKVIIVSGGSKTEGSKNQDLYVGKIDPNSSHEPLEENRRRVFGGSSTVWGGRCIPFDKIDFEKRDWIPNSGWPISYDELLPFYKRANKLLKAGNFEYDIDETSLVERLEIIEGFDNSSFHSNKIERWSTPVNFAVEFFSDLENNPLVKVLMDTHLIRIETETRKDIISSIFVSDRYKSFSIYAKTFILACGGIENPRLLLASRNRFHPNGIGNDFDVVGRYYMAHLNGFFADLEPKNRTNILFNFERDSEKVYFRRRWWVTDTAQKKYKIGNVIFFLHKSQNSEGHRDPLFSLVFIVKFLIALINTHSLSNIKIKFKENKIVLKQHFKEIIKGIWKQIPQIITLYFKRFNKRRLPFILPSVNISKLGLYFQSEQVPNPESRITLSENNFDEFGMPRANVDIKFSEIDKRTVSEAHNIFLTQFNSRNLGNYILYNENLDECIHKRISNFNSAAHHLGTTRMASDAKVGVVDKNCKVHGIDNLYVAGSSVFPTGGHANPTLTIVALSIKMADYLKMQCK